jgi:predicted enzyme related to lactoylglutathione lyase
MNRVVHFELGASDAVRAVEFYKSVFGWQSQKWDGPQEYYLMMTGAASEPGINGGILRLQDGQPRTVNSIAVESVDEFAKKVEAAGGKLVVPKVAIPGVGWLAYCHDTEGNIFGLHQPDPTAK